MMNKPIRLIIAGLLNPESASSGVTIRVTPNASSTMSATTSARSLPLRMATIAAKTMMSRRSSCVDSMWHEFSLDDRSSLRLSELYRFVADSHFVKQRVPALAHNLDDVHLTQTKHHLLREISATSTRRREVCRRKGLGQAFRQQRPEIIRRFKSNLFHH